jgi:LDH2 family malate/lactate/ureidoglycolate dehydrogenase
MGMVAGVMAMEAAIRKAAAAPIGYVGVRNSNHFGAAGYYACLALKHDMIGIAMSNTNNCVTAPGGRTSVIGTNPLAYAVPAGEEWPIFLDIALSTLSSTKVHAAKLEGRAIPEGLLVDAEGLPTTEFGEWPLLGSLWPVAGHKGYGLSVMVEVLSAVLTGAAVTSEVKGWVTQLSEPPGTGHAFIAIDVGKIMLVDEFKLRVDKMIRGIRESPKAKGAERIFLPGEMEWESQEVARKEGIALPERILGSLATLSQEVGLDFESLFQ